MKTEEEKQNFKNNLAALIGGKRPPPKKPAEDSKPKVNMDNLLSFGADRPREAPHSVHLNALEHAMNKPSFNIPAHRRASKRVGMNFEDDE